MNKIQRNLTDNLRRILALRDITVASLADSTGLSPAGLYKILNGERWPAPDNLEKIVDALGVSESDLFGEPTATVRPSLRAALQIVMEGVARGEQDRTLLDELTRRFGAHGVSRLAGSDEHEIADIWLILNTHEQARRDDAASLPHHESQKRKPVKKA